MVMGVYTWKEAGQSAVLNGTGAGTVPVHAFTAEPAGSRQLAITLGLVIAK
jgi:hypothetical protein